MSKRRDIFKNWNTHCNSIDISNFILKKQNYFDNHNKQINLLKEYNFYFKYTLKLRKFFYWYSRISISLFILLAILGVVFAILNGGEYFLILAIPFFLWFFALFVGFLKIFKKYQKWFFKYFDIFKTMMDEGFIDSNFKNYPENVQMCFYYNNFDNIPLNVSNNKKFGFSFRSCSETLLIWIKKYYEYFANINNKNLENN